MSPSSSSSYKKADNGEASDSSPEMIQYINQVFRSIHSDAETLNKKMRDLLSVVTTKTFTQSDAKAWGKMLDVISELAKKCSSIASMPAVQPRAEGKEKEASASSSSPTTTPKKRRAHIELSSGKRQKMAVVSVEARIKRRFSEEVEVEGDTKKKRFKRNHREGSERPGLAGGKRKGREEEGEGGREDVRLKRPRNGYFQDGDPPIEYEESSDGEEGGGGDEKPESVPVVLSSDEDEES
ncbi:hypothetical protein BDD12DRAFT_445017 [Trichophaea hybrida]|nr:hypothetical protein BDD12DRAFT_445017 [Trichophaea hybrida]